MALGGASGMPAFQLWKERDSAVKWHLSTSIAESRQLTRIERRVLLFLFAYYDRQHARIEYPGHLSFASRHHIPPDQLQGALLSLERAGYVRPQPSPANLWAYLPNALLLEEAYDRAKQASPELFIV
jgi:hypothetical protein